MVLFKGLRSSIIWKRNLLQSPGDRQRTQGQALPLSGERCSAGQACFLPRVQFKPILSVWWRCSDPHAHQAIRIPWTLPTPVFIYKNVKTTEKLKIWYKKNARIPFT